MTEAGRGCGVATLGGCGSGGSIDRWDFATGVFLGDGDKNTAENP